MDKEEILKELGLPYFDLVDYLKSKYGEAEHDYFCNDSMKSKNTEVTKADRGLYCHHVDEYRASMLSNTRSAQRYPFSWQKKDRLVYCNLIGHLILHFKIYIIQQKTKILDKSNITSCLGTGISYICKDINTMFEDAKNLNGWRKNCFDVISDSFEDYIFILKLIVCYINNEYVGVRQNKNFLVVGSSLIFNNEKFEIVGKGLSGIKVLTSNGEPKKIRYLFIEDKMTEYDFLKLLTMQLSEIDNIRISDQVYSNIKDFTEYVDEESFLDIIQILKNDFNACGNIHLSEKYLNEKDYGAITIDQYISKAIPSYCENNFEIKEKVPTFWKGKIPADVIKNNWWYIIRVEAIFELKEGNEPFVRCNNKSYLQTPISDVYDEVNNILTKRGFIYSNSLFYIPEEDKYYQGFKNSKGDIVEAKMTISFTKEDFKLFQERYHIYKMKILDGCYFTE